MRDSKMAASLHRNSACLITWGPESQQPTESQITRICMEIYLTIDKMVKMYKNSY